MQRMNKLRILVIATAIGFLAALYAAHEPDFLGDSRANSDSQAPSLPEGDEAGEVVVEVSGRVAWISPALSDGTPVERDEVLMRLESRELAAVLEHAEAAASEAERALSKILARVQRIGALFDRGGASQDELADTLDQEKVAREALQTAWQTVTKARSDVAATEVRAPLSGLVIEHEVRLGKFVSRGDRVARVGPEAA